MTIELANRLAELRKQKGLSQEELADRLQVSRQAVSKWERGEASPDTDNLIELAKIYEISLDELVGLSSNNTKDNKEEDHIEDNKEGIHINDDGIHIHDDEGNEVEIKDHKVLMTDSEGNQKVITKPSKAQRLSILVSCVTTILVVTAYLLLGSLLGLWAKAWVLFLLVIIIPSIFDSIYQKKLHKISFAVLVVFVYLLLNCWVLETPLWHPLWIMFLAIPIFYAITSFIKHSKDDDEDCCDKEE